MSPTGFIAFGVYAIIIGLFLVVTGTLRRDFSRMPATTEANWQITGVPETSMSFKPSDETLKDYTIVWEAGKSGRGWVSWYKRYSDNRKYLGTSDTFSEAEERCLKHHGS